MKLKNAYRPQKMGEGKHLKQKKIALAMFFILSFTCISILPTSHLYSHTGIDANIVNSQSKMDDSLQSTQSDSLPNYEMEYFSSQNESRQIKWLSFPVIDDSMHRYGIPNNYAGSMLGKYLNYPMSYIDSMYWSYDDKDNALLYISMMWQNLEQEIIQPMGFKILFNKHNLNALPALNIIGQKAYPKTKPIKLAKSHNYGKPFPNWIGYFVPYTQTVATAFSKKIPNSTNTYLDYIYSIKTQYRATVRDQGVYGGDWIVDPDSFTLSEGDMVEIKLMPGAPEEMYWNTQDANLASIEPATPQSFEYHEELDYSPIFVEFDPDNIPDEVGLFVADKCYGAAVVDGEITEVNFYYIPDHEAKTDGEIDIVFYYEGKSTKTQVAPLIYNPDSLLFESGSLKAGGIKDFAYVSYLKDEGSSMTPLITQLQDSYPNPFDFITNISFILADSVSVNLDIYNDKGYKVKTLLDAHLPKGKHGLSWDGTDDGGRRLAGGVYFYRLSTPETTQTQKMLLLK